MDCLVGNVVQIMLDGFSIAQFLLQLIMDCLVGNVVQIMSDGFSIAQFLLQLIVDCLVGNTVQIMLGGFRISQFLLQPASCTYPEPAQSSPYPHIPLPEDQQLFILLFS